MLRNPYTPGAGKPPAYLAGRDEIIGAAVSDLDDLLNGYTNQSKIFYGLRGVGKTVLLNAIENHADNKKITYEHIEISENDNFKAIISMCVIKLLKKISFTDTNNFQNDITELFLALGNNAKKLKKPICVFIDEIQYLKRIRSN